MSGPDDEGFRARPVPGAIATDLSAAIGPPPRNPAQRRGLPSRLLNRYRLVRAYGVPFRSRFVKASPNAVTVFFTHRGPVVGKFFARSASGRAALQAERLSYELFGSTDWRMPIVQWRPNGYLAPRLPNEARLDVRAHSMSKAERLDVAVWALNVLIDIYLAGYVHGDLQPHNIWFIDGRPVATDFETLVARSGDHPFLESGDITGVDPVTGSTYDAAFAPHDEWSFDFTVGVSLQRALKELRGRLSEEAATSADARSRLALLGESDSRIHNGESSR